jgi:hypothetical protein
MNPYKKHWPNQTDKPYFWEELVGWSLAVVGIAVVWGFALGTLADQPIQHSGNQTMEKIQ